MNIFFLDKNPAKAAQYHCDKHVVKMVLESAQLLSTAWWLLEPAYVNTGLYKPTHKNHPCAIWCRQKYMNYMWLCGLAEALCKEYTHRYGRKHASEKIINWCCRYAPQPLIATEETGMTIPALAMPDEYKQADPVKAYRAYYLGAKKHLLTYTNREAPSWLI